MSGLDRKKITKREFLKIVGLSGASLFTLGSLADELLAQAQSAKIPVAVMIKPNAFQPGYGGLFSAAMVFPGGYKAADVDVSSVRCEGACALDSIFYSDGRTIAFLFDSNSLRADLPCGFSVPFTVNGKLYDGTIFEGSHTVAIIKADQATIYHTSSRKRRSCNACKNHAVNRMYYSKQAADNDRAHPGCNCRIVEERTSWQNYVNAFWPDRQGGEAVYDRRWGWPPPLPEGLSLEYPLRLDKHLRRG